ncbi:MAG: serine acetyltransferase [Bacteroidia bacterium]|nr:serine acetyltransferase [Bacteroidia bacterium]
MIQSRTDYQKYLEADRIALKIKSGGNPLVKLVKNIFFPHYIWKFQKLLRKVEFHTNRKKGLLGKVVFAYHKYHFRRLSLRLGFSIPPNCFGPGLAIVHYGTIVVNSNARIGANCRIHVCTNIGASGGKPEAPQIGDNVYIGPGAKIYGDIQLANNTAIAANAAVGKSFFEENTLIGGIPAKVIKPFDISTVITHVQPSKAELQKS